MQFQKDQEKNLEQSVKASGWEIGAQHEEDVINTKFSKVDLPCEAQNCASWQCIVT